MPGSLTDIATSQVLNGPLLVPRIAVGMRREHLSYHKPQLLTKEEVATDVAIRRVELRGHGEL